MHEYGCDQERCAREILRRYDLSRHFDPAHPCFVHCSRIRPETGYALFAKMADILRINSNIASGMSSRREGAPSEETVGMLTHRAGNAARPVSVHAVADTSVIEGATDVLATVSDFRRRTWTIGRRVGQRGCGGRGRCVAVWHFRPRYEYVSPVALVPSIAPEPAAPATVAPVAAKLPVVERPKSALEVGYESTADSASAFKNISEAEWCGGTIPPLSDS